MTPDLVFSVANYLALPGWLLLAVAPGWKWTMKIATGLPLLLAALYLAVVAAHLGSAEGGFGSLEAVEKLFADRWIVVGGWIHYLSFDLFIGAWQVRDSRRMRIPHLAVLPCLVLTLMLGPVGLLGYFGLRAALRRNYYLA